MVLELPTDNPYAYGTVVIFPEGDVHLEGPEIRLQTSIKDRRFSTIDGDNFSNVAFEGYNNSKLWWLLYLANDFDFPFDLENTPGTDLLVPDLDMFKMANV